MNEMKQPRKPSFEMPKIMTSEEFEEDCRKYFEPQMPDGAWIDGDTPPAPPEMLVERVLPRYGVSFLGGQSGAGKSFCAIDLAVAIATGGQFFGYPVTKPGAVIYVAAEGAETLPNRLAAAKKARGVSAAIPIIVMRDVPDLADKKARREFQTKIDAATKVLQSRFGLTVLLLVLDTLGKAFSMKDENSAAEMNSVCRAAADLGGGIGAATLVLAHYGKAQETGLRGSSAMRGAAESVLAVLATRDETTGKCSDRRLVHTKSRIGEEGPVSGFELRDIDVQGAGGATVRAGCVEVTGPANVDAASAPKPTRGHATLLKAFIDAYERLADGVQKEAGFDGAPVQKVKVDGLRDELRSRGFLETDDENRITSASRKALSLVKTELLAKGEFVECEKLIWRVRVTSSPPA